MKPKMNVMLPFFVLRFGHRIPINMQTIVNRAIQIAITGTLLGFGTLSEAVTVTTGGRGTNTYTWTIHTTTGTDIASFEIIGKKLEGASINSHHSPDDSIWKWQGGVDGDNYVYRWESDHNITLGLGDTLAFSVELSDAIAGEAAISIHYDFLKKDDPVHYPAPIEPSSGHYVPVPEPSTFSLFGLTIAALALKMRHRR